MVTGGSLTAALTEASNVAALLDEAAILEAEVRLLYEIKKQQSQHLDDIPF